MSGEPFKPTLSATKRGPIEWMVHNRVTPNLMMLTLLVGGLFMTTRIKQEVFPEFSEDRVSVSVSYPGSSPEEIEQGIILAVEEAVRGLDGVKEVTATASEGNARVNIELESGIDQQKVYQDIKQEIDRITTFPEDAEEPQVELESHKREVVQFQVYGDVSERTLREVVEQIRDQLLQDPGITQVELQGVRDHEIIIEIPTEALRSYGLTLGQVAELVGVTAVELPGGGVKTRSGEILLRINERRDWARQFARIPIITTADGSVVRLRDIATVTDGFEDTDTEATYNGRRAIGVSVYRIGDQTPIGVSDSVRDVLAKITPDLPPGISCAVNRDQSDVYRQRLELLLKNAFSGLCVVLIVLSLFLEFKLAFWVTMGIPTSFIGAMLFLPMFGVSINMISMFAFIIALGIVVDDAIVAGENIYEYRQRGMTFGQAAIAGARDVTIPIAFSILTNIAAFLPLWFIPGIMGKVFGVIPVVVTVVFLISWAEALFILPSHLAHARVKDANTLSRHVHRWQQQFAALTDRFINGIYGPFLDRCIAWRYLTIAAGFALLIGMLAYAASGRMGFELMPSVESDYAVVTAVLPYGSPMAAVEKARDRLIATANQVVAGHGGDQLSTGNFAVISNNEVEVTAYLTDPGVRPISTTAFTRFWREKTGPIVGLESLRFESDRGGPGSGKALTVELSHRDIPTLNAAAQAMADRLAEFAQTSDIDDGYTPGKRQFDLILTEQGRSLGLTTGGVARQVRNAFYGAEALRQQRGRDEITVRVRLPVEQRTRAYDIEQLLIRTPAGTDVPLRQIAQVEHGRSYTTITRRDGRRTLQVTADVTPPSDAQRIQDTLVAEVFPQMQRDYPGLTCGFEGRQADISESLASLKTGFVFALLMIYVLLAIPFSSYLQPMIVMIAIPFGIVGAILGHLLMGYNLGIISMMGIVALAGVVVNDSLVMIDYANTQRREGASPLESIRMSGIRRFRPIILTTLTTFGGLAPMIFETSRQARFMIPMAISLGFGILFATSITLVLVPALYLVLEDVIALAHRILHRPASSTVADSSSHE